MTAFARIVSVTLNPALDLSTETERVTPGPKLRCDAPRVDPGGGGVNVARAVAILGGRCAALVAAGGPVGAQLMGLLRAEGLDPEDLGVDAPTRQSLSVRERATGAQFRFVTPGPRWGPAEAATAAARILAAMGPGALLVASGSQPQGAPADFFLALNDRLAARGAAMVLDTSGAALAAAATRRGAPLHTLRMDDAEAVALAAALGGGAAQGAGAADPAGLADPTAMAGLDDPASAAGLAALTATAAPADPIAKAGLDDPASAAALADPAAMAALAEGLRRRGVAQTVAVGMGALGTVVACAAGRFLCRPPRVQVLSAVGAGDSFVAAYALAVAGGADPVAACVRGVAAAASAVETPGTQLCVRAAVEAHAAGVVVEAL